MHPVPLHFLYSTSISLHDILAIACCNFDIVIFPLLSSNIHKSPAYWVFVSQLIRYAHAFSVWGFYHEKPMHTEGVVARRWASDPWRKNQLTAYPYVACTLQATRRGAQETRRAGLEHVLIHCVLRGAELTLSMCRGHYRWWPISLPFYSQSLYRYWRCF